MPPVAWWQAVAKAGSAGAPRRAAATAPTAAGLSGAGRRTVARSSSTSASTSERSSPGAAGRSATSSATPAALQPAGEVGQVALGRLVGPLQVVDRQQRRALGAEVGRQPVQAVDDRLLGLAVGRGERAGGSGAGQPERRRRQPRRPVEQGGVQVGVGTGEHGLEEPAGDAEPEAALELAPARRQDGHAGRPRLLARGVREARLADPGRALEDDQAAVAGRRGRQRRGDRGELVARARAASSQGR